MTISVTDRPPKKHRKSKDVSSNAVGEVEDPRNPFKKAQADNMTISPLADAEAEQPGKKKRHKKRKHGDTNDAVNVSELPDTREEPKKKKKKFRYETKSERQLTARKQKAKKAR